MWGQQEGKRGRGDGRSLWVCVSSCLTRAPCPAHGAPLSAPRPPKGIQEGVWAYRRPAHCCMAGADSVVRQLYAKKSVFKKKVKISGPYQLL